MKSTYGLIGYPLGHSASKAFFTKKFANENINAEYLMFEIPGIGQLPEIIQSTPNLKGLNVTIPYKEQVIPYLDELDADAEEIGAVNVIKISKKQDKIHLKGYNSDLIGFQQSIAPFIKEHHNKALILGTGGASKAVRQGLKNLGLQSEFVSRNRQQPDTIHYDDLNEDILSEFTVIVNASPVGTYPKDDACPDIPYQHLTSRHLLYDLVYNPPLTKFLRLGKEHGAQIKNGEEMLELQAIAAWEIWNK